MRDHNTVKYQVFSVSTTEKSKIQFLASFDMESKPEFVDDIPEDELRAIKECFSLFGKPGRSVQAWCNRYLWIHTHTHTH
mmetsp:Transcript_3637/g.6206  ORF Transcript_3637/g.6206 Transcript_3637/m.6206 type:complete len:80 (+) Transcript_3637:347-586(+)